jgi:hypothetical protein
MASGKPRDPAKERFWRDTVGQWEESGLTVGAYCQRHRLSEPSFYAWRRELARRDRATPTFVPVQVLAESPAAIEIVLVNDRIVRVRPGFDERTLRRVLALVEEGEPC